MLSLQVLCLEGDYRNRDVIMVSSYGDPAVLLRVCPLYRVHTHTPRRSGGSRERYGYWVGLEDSIVGETITLYHHSPGIVNRLSSRSG